MHAQCVVNLGQSSMYFKLISELTLNSSLPGSIGLMIIYESLLGHPYILESSDIQFKVCKADQVLGEACKFEMTQN